jgi:hypothetical protein
MADSAAIDAVKPVLTGKDCKQNLPTWGVTREFRFGQFIQLYDERVVNGKRQVTPLKFNSDGDVTELPDVGRSTAAATAVPAPQPGIPLQALAASNFAEAVGGAPATTVEVRDVEALVRTGTVTLEGERRAQVDLGPETVSALRSGDAVQALVYADGWKSTVVRLKPVASREVGVEGGELDSVLAQRQIAADGGYVRLDDVGMRDLLDAGETLSPIWREDVPGELARVRLTGVDPPARPAAGAFVVDNLTEFLSAPIIPTTDGRSVALNLDSEAVRLLRFGEATTVQAGGREVTLFLNDAGRG